MTCKASARTDLVRRRNSGQDVPCVLEQGHPPPHAGYSADKSWGVLWPHGRLRLVDAAIIEDRVRRHGSGRG